MQTISSISEFLLEAHTEYRIFDMGRTIHTIDPQAFLEIENGVKAVPYPRQQMCWFGILFWNKASSNQQYIWFLKLPLDENGCVVSAHRDQFLHIIVDALGKEFIAEHKDAKLPDNPYQFMPVQQQMADFNAMAKHELGLVPSTDAESAKQYLLSPSNHDWQTLTVQGLADCATSCLDVMLGNAIVQHFDDYPLSVIKSLCATFENKTLPDTLRVNLTAKYMQEEALSEKGLYLLRAISRNNQDPQLKHRLYQILQDESVPKDLLITLAGRYWSWCTDSKYLLALMEACARENCFHALYPDLVQIPSIRSDVLAVLRSPVRSPALSQAIGELFQ